MDLVAWIVLGAVAAAALVLLAFAPRLKRDNLRRQLDGGGGAMGGIGAGLDAVWRPTAEDARANWAAEVELPAPAPAPGDKGGMDDGKIVIEVPVGR